MPLKLNSAGGGSVTLDTPVTAANTTLTVPTGNGSVVTANASGDVGIGTTSPAAILETSVNASSGSVNAVFRNSNNGANTTKTITASFRGADTISGSKEASRILVGPADQDWNGAYLSFQTRGSDILAERMRITAGGDVLFGQTAYATPPTTGTDLLAGGLVINPSRRTTGSSANCNWDATSGIFARSTSSLRYKTDVQNAAYGLSDVLKLRPVTYKGKSEADGDKLFGGFIAEEIDALGLKEFVEYDAEGRPDSLAYGNMVSLLAKAIQELKAELDSVKAELTELKGAA